MVVVVVEVVEQGGMELEAGYPARKRGYYGNTTIVARGTDMLNLHLGLLLPMMVLIPYQR